MVVPTAPRKPCPVPGCPETVPARGRYCPTHASRHERTRGTRTQRGYGREHEAERAKWGPIIATGTVHCVRCGELIEPGAKWHPDHTDDRTGYLGPAHARCNLRAAGRAVRYRGNDR